MSKNDENDEGRENGSIEEKLDYTRDLLIQIQMCQKAFLTMNRDIIAAAMLTLLAMIPDKDQDPEFQTEKNNACYMVEKPTGRYYNDVTHDRPCEITYEAKEYDWLQVFHAIINLLRRRGVLWKDKEHEDIS